MIDAWLTQVDFVGGCRIPLAKDSILVIVGPNNTGKSATLGALVSSISSGPPSQSCLDGPPRGHFGQTWEEVWDALEPYRFGSEIILPSGQRMHEAMLPERMAQGNLSPFGGLLATFLSTFNRLNDSGPAMWPNLDQNAGAALHPFHLLYTNADLEERASTLTKRAFKQDLVIDRMNGPSVVAHIGPKPQLESGEDRISPEYIGRIKRLPRLDRQGDGVRSFVSIVSRIVGEQRPLLFIDEPEAFLHPPQARMIAEAIAEYGGGRQTFIATHSSDVLQGLLANSSRRVQVVRLARRQEEFSASHMPSAQIVDLWNDPILRFSNILDGLFHDGVVVAEADGDCRFYEAMAAAAVTAEQRPDIHYTYTGGKDRIPLVVRALKSLNVPVASALDFDVLNREQPLRSIIEAHGGDWREFEADLGAIQASVEAKAEFLSTARFIKEVSAQLKECGQSEVVPVTVLREIRKLIRKASPWDAVKLAGLSALQQGGVTVLALRLLERLKAIGIFVVPVGEMEGFCRTIEPRKNRWVEAVLKRQLSSDPDLGEARKFVVEIAAFIRSQ